jgi:hypothetical protein
VVSALAIAGSGSNSGRGVYTIETVATEERVAALNAGFAVGALLAGVALSVDTVTAYDAMVLANAAGAAAQRGLGDPDAARTAGGRRAGSAARTHRPALPRRHRRLLGTAAQRDRADRGASTVDGDAHRCAVQAQHGRPEQVRASRGAGTLAGSARVLRWAGLGNAAACPVLWLSGATSSVTTIVLLVVAAVLVTASELWQSAASWGVTTLLPPPGRRGEYLGAFKLGTAAQSMAGPAILTWLAIGTGGWGCLFLTGPVLAGPVIENALTHRSTQV